ncbi:MAG: sugar ABC transporter ATP-binding protein [Oscillospiraceae bacterium]
MEKKAILELKDICKQYPGVKALDNVSLNFYAGEIHALMGENGAGKSTLIKTLSGAITPDSGEISFENVTYSKMTPHISKELGIGVIYQEFNLMPTLSVAENIFAGNEIGGKILFNKKKIEAKTLEVFERMHVQINPCEKVQNLSVANMQLVEIAKALTRDVKILIMDEPTAPLTTNEVDILFEIVKILKSQGVTIIYISHRINEVFAIADRVSVLRDGCFISTSNTSEISRNELIRQMVGRDVNDAYPKRTLLPENPMLELEKLCGNGVTDISFAVRKREIVGLSGLVGAGRTETMRMVFGADPRQSGTIRLDGKEISPNNPKAAVELGIGLIPEDRKQQGLLIELPITWNTSMATMKDISKFSVLSKKKENKVVNSLIDSIQIKTPTITQLVKNLSGGNQQKVVLAKWLAAKCKVLIFDEPTRGIDVGARHEIYKLMNELCEQGLAIVMISSDMEELLGMSDRIVVLCEGQQAGILEKSEFSQETILSMASGQK